MTQEERIQGSIWVRKLEIAMKNAALIGETDKTIDPCIIEKMVEMRNGGKLYSEIGALLHMSPKTVQKYLNKEKSTRSSTNTASGA